MSAIMFQTPGTPGVVVYQTPVEEDGTVIGKGHLDSGTKVFQMDGARPVPWCDIMKRPDRRIRMLKKSERTDMMKKTQEIIKRIGVKNLLELLRQRERDIRMKMIGKREGPDGRLRMLKREPSKIGESK